MFVFNAEQSLAQRPDDKLRTQFINTYDNLRKTTMFAEMEATIEASPWHREANVLVHTDMVVDQYIRLTDDHTSTWSYRDLLGAMACAFHDVGKPGSKIQKYREDRGNYFAFHGHEVLSSRMFETWAVENAKTLHMHPAAIFSVCWMIEHHMPWSVEDAEKRRWLALTASNMIDVDVYTRALLADQLGRIADDADAKNKRAAEWIACFKELCAQVEMPPTENDAPKMFMLIGTSGSGKSTVAKDILSGVGVGVVFSLDKLRHEWYDSRPTPEGYANAFKLSTEDKDFESKADAAFMKIVKAGESFVVDNVNASVKRRNKYIRAARKHGYTVIAMTLPISVNTVVARQTTRGDKSVPEHVVRQQYNSISQPSYGEFDVIIASLHNFVYE